MSERPKKAAPRCSAAARARLARRLERSGLGTAPSTPIERQPDRSGPQPLSTGQERLLLAEQVLGPSPLYNVPLAAHLIGALDVRALESALNALLRRHEVLRTRFVAAGERVEAHVLPSVELALPPVDLGHLPSSQRYVRALELARAELCRPFDLAQGPPLRAGLWRLADGEHLFLLALHHLACDAATIRVLCAELGEHYAAARAGETRTIPAPELQHGDYARWQRRRSESAEARAAVDAFAARLRAPPAPLELPTDRARPAQWTAHGGWRTRRMDAQLGSSLAELARAHGATPFQLFLAAFHALLRRLTGQHDLVVGIPIALRDEPELERLPGFLVNTLALRTACDADGTFLELLARVRETALEAYAQRAAPFERVLARVQPPRDPARTPLFDVMFDHRADLPHELVLPGLTSARLVAEDQLHSGTSKADLALYTELSGESFSVSAEFRSDLFDARTIDLWLERFETLLAALARNPHARLSELALLGPRERELLARWERGPALEDCESTVHAAVAAVAARLPDKIALEHGAVRVSYHELEQRSNRLAHHLVARGVERGEPVALCLARTDEIVVALLAVLKAGGAYLPLDPAYPPERLTFMLRDSRARVWITAEALAPSLPEAAVDVLDILCLERERAAIASRSS